MNTAVEPQDRNALAVKIDAALFRGDVSKLTDEERVMHLHKVCDSTGLNPLTGPIGYITLPNGKMIPYVKRDGTDQLRKLHGVNIEIVDRKVTGDLLTVHVRARDKSGRTDEDFGAVSIAGLRGEAAANAIMKAVTKGKRRVTLSICGLGWLDESEVESIAGAFTDDEPPAKPVEPPRMRARAPASPREVPVGLKPPENVSDQMHKLEEAEVASSGDAYAMQWQEIMANATSADELIIRWNAERAMRGNIDWHDAEQPARLKEMVMRRREELQKAVADDTR